MNITFQQFKNTKVILRALSPEDIGEIFVLRSDKANNVFIDRPLDVSLNDSTIFVNKIMLEAANHKTLYWAIADPTTNKLIGSICLFNFDAVKSSAELGYEVLPRHQGQGIAYEAIQIILKYAFSILKIEAVFAYPHKDNMKSQKLLEKIGFIKTFDTDIFYKKYELHNSKA